MHLSCRPRLSRWMGIPKDSFLQVLQTCDPFLSGDPPVENHWFRPLNSKKHSYKATRSTTASLTAACRLKMKDTRQECFWHASDNLPATRIPLFYLISFSLPSLSRSLSLPIFLSQDLFFTLSPSLSLDQQMACLPFCLPLNSNHFQHFCSLSGQLSTNRRTRTHANVFP